MDVKWPQDSVLQRERSGARRPLWLSEELNRMKQREVSRCHTLQGLADQVLGARCRNMTL